MNRRELLARLSVLPLPLLGGRLYAAPDAGSRLLVVFLRGGYDAASLLVPYESSFYYESRPDIAIAKPSGDLASSLPLASGWGLHPALRESLYPYFKSGELAFVPFAGTHDVSRSHFETQDSIEMGQALDGHRNYSSGFLNRLATVLKGSTPMAFTEQLPVIFQGDAKVPNTVLKTLSKPSVDARRAASLPPCTKGRR